MKRIVLLVSFALAAALAVTPLADARAAITRAYPKSVYSTTTPERDTTSPFTFTTSGRVFLPPYCARGTGPGPGHNCVPAGCPRGTTNPRYCTYPSTTTLCRGRVKVQYKVGASVFRAEVDLGSNCRFSVTSSFEFPRPLRPRSIPVYTRFDGNAYLHAKSARQHFVTIG